MTKKSEQTPAPWVKPATDVVQVEEEVSELAVEFADGVTSLNDPRLGNRIAPPAPTMAEHVKAAFSGVPVEQTSPFAPKAKKATESEKIEYEMGDAPLWGDLVRFVQKHGDVIIQARHPQPRGVAVDTIYRGVTVFAHPTCELRHKTLGWITWADAQYE